MFAVSVEPFFDSIGQGRPRLSLVSVRCTRPLFASKRTTRAWSDCSTSLAGKVQVQPVSPNFQRAVN